MSAGKHGSSEWTISIDATPGAGSPTAITNHVLEMDGQEIENVLQASDAYGDSWDEHTPTGKRRVKPFKIRGFFDDTNTTGPHTVLRITDDDADPNGSTRTFSSSPGNSKTFSGECRLGSYKVLGKNGNLTEFESMIQPTGAWTWS